MEPLTFDDLPERCSPAMTMRRIFKTGPSEAPGRVPRQYCPQSPYGILLHAARGLTSLSIRRRSFRSAASKSVTSLQIDPKIWRRTEIAGQSECRIGGDGGSVLTVITIVEDFQRRTSHRPKVPWTPEYMSEWRGSLNSAPRSWHRN